MFDIFANFATYAIFATLRRKTKTAKKANVSMI